MSLWCILAVVCVCVHQLSIRCTSSYIGGSRGAQCLVVGLVLVVVVIILTVLVPSSSASSPSSVSVVIVVVVVPSTSTSTSVRVVVVTTLVVFVVLVVTCEVFFSRWSKPAWGIVVRA